MSDADIVGSSGEGEAHAEPDGDSENSPGSAGASPFLTELDEQTLAAIREGDAQLDRGEGIPLADAFAELRRKHFGE